MSLDKVQFDKIINLLVKAYMDCAKEYIRSHHGEISFEQAPNSTKLFSDYFDALKDVYGDTPIPAVYREVCNVNNRVEQSIDNWITSRKVLVELRPLNLNAVVQQLNQDFSVRHQLSSEYHIQDRQRMMLTFMLSDQPTLIQQLMALPKSHFNKFLIAAMIACTVLAAVCSFTWLIPTAIAATRLFFQLKKPGHREKFDHDNSNQGYDMEGLRAANMLANF